MEWEAKANLLYAALSTAMIFSTPSTLAASSATDLTPLPATNAWTGPPSFFAAVIALRDPALSFPSLCSKTASTESNRRRAAGFVTNEEVVVCINLGASQSIDCSAGS